MLEFFESKEVVTRKDHKCGFCNRVIPKGTKVEYSKGKYDDYFFRSYLDDFCKEIINIFRDDYCDDGYNEDCFSELDFWFFECDTCEERLDLDDNDIKNRQIIFYCSTCGKEIKMDYEKVLEKVRENK